MLNYPHPTVNDSALEYVFFISKKRALSHLSFPICQILSVVKVDRRSLVAYKRATAIMVSLLMCMAPAGYDVAALLKLLAQLSAPMHQRPAAQRKNVLWQQPAEAWKPAGAAWLATCKSVTTFPAPGIRTLSVTFLHSFRVFTLLVNVAAVIGWADPEQTPGQRLGRSEKRLQNTQRESAKQNVKEILTWKYAYMITQIQSLRRKCISGCQDD